ncbi:MAG: hypothetical protein RLZZ580_550, partial [Cyanobacteriota bacterium]
MTKAEFQRAIVRKIFRWRYFSLFFATILVNVGISAVMAQDTGLSEQVAQLNRGQDTIWVLLTGSLVFFIENLGLKPRRFTTALPLNTSAFTKYMLKCETWKKHILTDFTPHPNKSRYCGA